MRDIFRAMMVSCFSMFMLIACAPEIGSAEWCAELKKNPQGDWTIDDVTNYAKHCLLK